MKLSKLLVALLIVLTTSVATAQDYKKEIETEFNAYLQSIVDMDFEKSVEYITPEFFEIVPKSQMILMMEQTFKNPSIEFELLNSKILSIGDSETIDKKAYSLVTYSNQMNMKFHPEEKDESEDAKTLRNNMMKLSFEQAFGADNVKFNDATGFFEIQVQKDVYAISQDGKSNWKFVVVEPKQKMLLEKVLPKKLIDRI